MCGRGNRVGQVEVRLRRSVAAQDSAFRRDADEPKRERGSAEPMEHTPRFTSVEVVFNKTVVDLKTAITARTAHLVTQAVVR